MIMFFMFFIIRSRSQVEFFQLFNMGYQNYSQGEWQVARRILCDPQKRRTSWLNLAFLCVWNAHFI